MAYSSILGGETAPSEPRGRETELLGPSDNSDSGSDTIGTDEAGDESTDAAGTGQRGAVAGPDAREGADIMPDRVVNLAQGDVLPEAGAGASGELTDLDDPSDDEDER